MDRAKIIDTLELAPGGGLAITDMQMVQWGREIIFDIHYLIVPLERTPEPPITLRLIFRDCREIKYKVYAHIGAHEMGIVTPTADVAELRLGQGNHRKDAHILTNHFSIAISYGEALVERDNRRYALPV
jgi:hypothetical protein